MALYLQQNKLTRQNREQVAKSNFERNEVKI
jgi:hypothetical protein